ncbi:hypothetical protein [Streptomyces sp. NPDC048272]|uniref:hypothetical protein n=1 Tax=Streptomyces sp. NPDC048272 TaxID=3154616 RepID=UPI0034189E96
MATDFFEARWSLVARYGHTISGFDAWMAGHAPDYARRTGALSRTCAVVGEGRPERTLPTGRPQSS